MSEIEKYYNGEIIVDFEEETELEKKYNEVAELYSKAVKKKIEYRKEIERLNNIIKEVEKFVEEVLSSTKGVINDYMYHKEHNKERIELLREDIVMYKHILEILDKVDKGE